MFHCVRWVNIFIIYSNIVVLSELSLKFLMALIIISVLCPFSKFIILWISLSLSFPKVQYIMSLFYIEQAIHWIKNLSWTSPWNDPQPQFPVTILYSFGVYAVTWKPVRAFMSSLNIIFGWYCKANICSWKNSASIATMTVALQLFTLSIFLWSMKSSKKKNSKYF